MNNRERLLATLAAVYAFYDREITELACRFWEEDMAAYPIDAVERAFAAHRRDPDRGQWLPKPADIIRQLDGDAAERAALAWSEVLECARNGGAGFLQLPAEARAALDSIGGMLALRLAADTQLSFLQRQFSAGHRAVVHRRMADELLLGVQAVGRLN